MDFLVFLILLILSLFPVVYLLAGQLRQSIVSPGLDDDDLQCALRTFKATTLETRAHHFRGQTLKALWRLHNPFVSTCTAFQRRYRKALLSHFMSTKGDDWTAIAQAAASALRPHLKPNDGQGRGRDSAIAVRDAVRDVSLAAALKAIFNIGQVDHATLVYIGTEIHELVLWKKCFDLSASPTTTAEDIPDELHKRVDRLIATLCQISLPYDSSPPVIKALLYPNDHEDGVDFEFNPMNLIMPAFESPWRAILYTLLAVLQNPSDSQNLLTLRDSSPDTAPSHAALAIAYESLRLYPPVRRVLREYPVDVEHLHRDERYWGSTALQFNPARFLNEKGYKITPSDAWMPFAAGPMRCPAATGYSARMIVTVTGEILRQIFPREELPKWFLDGEEWDDDARNGGVLRGGREEYANVTLHVG